MPHILWRVPLAFPKVDYLVSYGKSKWSSNKLKRTVRGQSGAGTPGAQHFEACKFFFQTDTCLWSHFPPPLQCTTDGKSKVALSCVQTLANSHCLPFQIDSRVKAKDPALASVIPAYHHPSNSLSLPFAFPDPSEGWAVPLPRATRRKKETGLSGHDCPKGVGLKSPNWIRSKKWNRPALTTSRTQLPLQIVHNQIPSTLANNREQVKV